MIFYKEATVKMSLWPDLMLRSQGQRHRRHRLGRHPRSRHRRFERGGHDSPIGNMLKRP